MLGWHTLKNVRYARESVCDGNKLERNLQLGRGDEPDQQLGGGDGPDQPPGGDWKEEVLI